MKNQLELYGINYFSDQELKNRVSEGVYKEFQKVKRRTQELSLETADAIANAVKMWAIDNGATHFTHWFQPLTEATAEKHDSFIAINPNGIVMPQFSGKDLIKGEADTSSFPNGGVRSTFEARGYTAWDASSPMFVRGNDISKTLYIPTAFLGYNGETLDKKVPLLRSLRSIEKQVLRVQKAIGDTESSYVDVNLGVEQEYFLISKESYKKRQDLLLGGRTIFGANPPKGQELSDHYYGTIKDKVSNYMAELDAELWKIGVMAKTKHNEVSPNQFELAVMFSSANISVDQNQLVMDIMKKVAVKHKLTALLHEKPFANINGSGKHCNWSISTDAKGNLLDPKNLTDGDLSFLIYVTAIIEAVDRYGDLLRASTATPGNDFRLGGHEAPPAIISIYLGDQLTEIFENVEKVEITPQNVQLQVKTGIKNYPKIPKDASDRNRTSPFAFTGNKFEFRMPGSSASPSTPTYIINAIVADVLREYADEFEQVADKSQINTKIIELIKERYHRHKRRVFNGNGYDKEWIKEAKERGISNLRNTIEGLPGYLQEESVAVLERTKVLSRAETESIFKIYSERYCNVTSIEVRTAIKMCRTEIFPAITTYLNSVLNSIKNVKEVFGDEELVQKDKDHVLNIIRLKNDAKDYVVKLSTEMKEVEKIKDQYERAKYLNDHLVPILVILRNRIDKIEIHVDKNIWPIPTYTDLLFKL